MEEQIKPMERRNDQTAFEVFPPQSPRNPRGIRGNCNRNRSSFGRHRPAGTGRGLAASNGGRGSSRLFAEPRATGGGVFSHVFGGGTAGFSRPRGGSPPKSGGGGPICAPNPRVAS